MDEMGCEWCLRWKRRNKCCPRRCRRRSKIKMREAPCHHLRPTPARLPNRQNLTSPLPNRFWYCTRAACCSPLRPQRSGTPACLMLKSFVLHVARRCRRRSKIKMREAPCHHLWPMPARLPNRQNLTSPLHNRFWYCTRAACCSPLWPRCSGTPACLMLKSFVLHVAWSSLRSLVLHAPLSAMAAFKPSQVALCMKTKEERMWLMCCKSCD
jgi:hypothetical protein